MSKILILSDLGIKIGLGHYARAKILNRDIKKILNNKKDLYNLYVSDKKYSFTKTIRKNNIYKILNEYIEFKGIKKIVFNVSRFLEPHLYDIIVKIKKRHKKVNLYAIDGFINKQNFFRKIWIPNVALKNSSAKYGNKKNIIYGWDKIIIEKKVFKKKINVIKKILILIGGTDKYNIGKKLPKLLCAKFKNIKFIWVKGPFAKTPIKGNCKNLVVIKNKLNLNKIYSQADYAFVVFGVTFFEVLNNKIPHVLFFHKKKKIDLHLISSLKKLKFNVSNDCNDALNKLKKLTENELKSKKQVYKLSKYLNFNKRNKVIKNFLEI